MSEYSAPLKDIRFVMQELAGLDQVVALPGCEEASADVVDAILDEAARFAGEVRGSNAATTAQQVDGEEGTFTSVGFSRMCRALTCCTTVCTSAPRTSFSLTMW